MCLVTADAYTDEARGYVLGRGREYHSSDENIDERFVDEYASSESSISVYGNFNSSVLILATVS